MVEYIRNYFFVFIANMSDFKNDLLEASNLFFELDLSNSL